MNYEIRRISITLSTTHALFYRANRLVLVDDSQILNQLGRILEYEYTLYRQAQHKHLADSYGWQNMNSDDVPVYYTRSNTIPVSTDGFAITLAGRVVYWTINVTAAQAVLYFCNQERNYWRKD